MGSSAGDLLNDLAAVQSFLNEFKGTVSQQVFAESLKAQVLGLSSKIAVVRNFKPEEATQVLSVLRQGPWDQASLETLSQKVSASVGVCATPKAAPQATQVFLGIEAYCTKDLINRLQDKDGSMRLKIAHLASFMGLLGVVAPSEKSVQRCVGFLLYLHAGAAAAVAMDSTQKLCIAMDLKSTLRTTTAKMKNADRLLEFPMTPAEFQTLKPAEYAACYCNQGPERLDIPLAELMVVVQSVPMRKTNKALKDKETPMLNVAGSVDQGAMGTAMAMMQQMHMVQCKTMEMVARLASGHGSMPTTFSPGSASSSGYMAMGDLGCNPATPRVLALGDGYGTPAPSAPMAPSPVPKAMGAHVRDPEAEQHNPMMQKAGPQETSMEKAMQEYHPSDARQAHPSIVQAGMIEHAFRKFAKLVFVEPCLL